MPWKGILCFHKTPRNMTYNLPFYYYTLKYINTLTETRKNKTICLKHNMHVMKRFKDGIMVTYIWQGFLEVYFYSNIITCQDIYMEYVFLKTFKTHLRNFITFIHWFIAIFVNTVVIMVYLPCLKNALWSSSYTLSLTKVPLLLQLNLHQSLL